jgi:hypothetical protein
MIHVGDFLAEADRYKTILAEVERDRVRGKVARRSLSLNGYRRLAARVGERLVSWGCQLQAWSVADSQTGA